MLALRLGQAGHYLDTGELRLFTWPVGFSWPVEALRAAGIVLGLGLLLRAAAGRGAWRCLLPLALPLVLGLCLASCVLPLPAVLGFLGSRTGLLLLVSVFGVLWSLLLRRPDAASVLPGRRESIAVFFAVAILLGSVIPSIPGTAWLRQSALTGDEPEYMLTVVSLLDDGDVLLRNNSEQDAAREFGASGYRFPLPRPIHNIGLPLLVAPAYALGRWLSPEAPQRVVWLQMALITAWLAAELHALLRPRGRLCALFGASAVLLPPLLSMAVQIYPEMPAATLAVLAWRRLGGQQTPGKAHALALAALPWLHVKYSALGVGLLVAAAVLRGPRRAAPGLVALICSLIGLSLWSAGHYDSFLPTASYGRTATVLSPGVFWGALGLLFDQSFGLLARAPAFLLVLPGVVLLARRSPREALALGLIVSSLFSVAASYHLWWAGWSPPGRFLVPIVPFLVIFLLEALEPRRSVLACLAGLLWTLSLAAGALLVPAPPTWLGGSRALIYQDPVDPSAFAVLLSRGFDLCRLLPRMVMATPRDWALGLVLAGLAGLGGLALLRCSRRNLRGPGQVTLLLLCVLPGAALLLSAADSAVDRRWPEQRWHHALNQGIRDFLPVAAEPGRHRFFPAPPAALLSRLSQRYEAEGLRGNHMFFQDRPDPSASGGLTRCAGPFDPALAPIPLAFKPPVEFVPWPAGTYIASFRLSLPEAAQEPGLVVSIGVRAPFSECAVRPSLLARRELQAAEIQGGPVDVPLRFQLRCITPKLEWLVDAYGQSVCVDRVVVTAEQVAVE